MFFEVRRTTFGVRPGNPFGINGLARTSGWPEGPEPVPWALRDSFEGARPGLPVPRALRAQCAAMRPLSHRYTRPWAGFGRDRQIRAGLEHGFGRSPRSRSADVVTDVSRSGVRASADGCVGERLCERRYCWRRQCAAFSRKMPTVIGAVVPLPVLSMPSRVQRRCRCDGSSHCAKSGAVMTVVAAGTAEADARKRDARGRREIGARSSC